MKLDSTVSKVYFSRDGRVAAYIDTRDPLPWGIDDGDGYSWQAEGYEVDGDWLPAVAPTFPVLPPKPGLVLFTQETWKPSEVYWGTVYSGVLYVVSPKGGHGATYDLDYAKIVIIPHDDNDSEAVRLIEEAKR